jgi:hypothetical protein
VRPHHRGDRPRAPRLALHGRAAHRARQGTRASPTRCRDVASSRSGWKACCA